MTPLHTKIDPSLGIENQWTFLRPDSLEKNENAWQLGVCLQDECFCLGIFDHLLLDNHHTRAFGEGNTLEADKIFSRLLLELIPNSSFLSAYLIPTEACFQKRDALVPKNYSRLRWCFTPKTERREILLTEALLKDEVQILSPLDKSGQLGLGFGKNKDLALKYFQRWGRDPDEAPDVLYVSSSLQAPSSFMAQAQLNFLKGFARHRLQDYSSQDWACWKRLLQHFERIFLAMDGHLYCWASPSQAPELSQKLSETAQSYGLPLAQDHLLF